MYYKYVDEPVEITEVFWNTFDLNYHSCRSHHSIAWQIVEQLRDTPYRRLEVEFKDHSFFKCNDFNKMINSIEILWDSWRGPTV